jgi:hypothetical protein
MGTHVQGHEGQPGAQPGGDRVAWVDQQVSEPVEPASQLLTGGHVAQCGLGLLQEPGPFSGAVAEQFVVAAHYLLASGRGGLLLLRPADELVDLGEEVIDKAGQDLFLGLEVVVHRGLGDAQPLGDLAQ